MLKFLFSIIMILHGLVHILYFGQSLRYFELQKGMIWPDNSWIFSGFVDENVVRKIAASLCIIAAIGFVIGGVSLIINHKLYNVGL